METTIVSKSKSSVKIEVTINFTESMLDSEHVIQDALNSVGNLATAELLKRFDADGSDIIVKDLKLTSKGQSTQIYQTPYGETSVSRHVYQSSKGGKTYCPLEQNARILLKATPRYAEQISHKAAEMASTQVAKDMKNNHHRDIPRSYIKKLSDAVAAVVQIKEEKWSYKAPDKLEDVKTISIGLDGTCMFLSNDGYRQAMVGTVALYNSEGERLHTTYVAAEPEYGKEKFKQRLEREINHAKACYSDADVIGLADGASDNWDFLKKYVDTQVLDFYHATEYLGSIAPIISKKIAEQKQWLEDTCHNLKHKHGAASRILTEMKALTTKKVSKLLREKLNAAITYFTNHKTKMTYAKERALNHPIGSGVTEAGCKVIVKQRLCKSGMKWKEKGASFILSLRALSYSTGRWEQFWSKVNQYGF